MGPYSCTGEVPFYVTDIRRDFTTQSCSQWLSIWWPQELDHVHELLDRLELFAPTMLQQPWGTHACIVIVERFRSLPDKHDYNKGILYEIHAIHALLDTVEAHLPTSQPPSQPSSQPPSNAPIQRLHPTPQSNASASAAHSVASPPSVPSIGKAQVSSFVSKFDEISSNSLGNAGRGG